MKGPVKVIVLAVAVLVLVGGAFAGGIVYQNAKTPTPTAGPGGNGIAFGDGSGVPGGPMADLSEEEQAELESMTEEERQAWMQEHLGDAPAGGPMRGGTLEGTVLEVADDTITLQVENGSQTIYIDDDTTIAYAEGAGELATGADVLVIAEPSADGVTNATLVVVM
jgi:hypothetical protein